MVVVSAQATGAEDFIEAVWQGGELFVDEDEAFKKALGGLPYKNRWLFKPSVLARLGSVVGNGRDFSDLNDKSQMLGGTMVVDAAASSSPSRSRVVRPRRGRRGARGDARRQRRADAGDARRDVGTVEARARAARNDARGRGSTDGSGRAAERGGSAAI